MVSPTEEPKHSQLVASAGPLIIDPTGIWATTEPELVVSPSNPNPTADLLTGPDGEPWFNNMVSPTPRVTLSPFEEWEQDLAQLHQASPVVNDTGSQPLILDTDAELRALPSGLLNSPPHTNLPSPTPLSLFIDQLAAAPAAPVLAAPPLPAEPPTIQQPTPWRSDRLAKKAKAQQEAAAKKGSTKDLPVERAQGVLMSKWGILEESETPKEQQKKKYLKMYDGPLVDVAVAAVDGLLTDGPAKLSLFCLSLYQFPLCIMLAKKSRGL